jgi:hypothetical protein
VGKEDGVVASKTSFATASIAHPIGARIKNLKAPAVAREAEEDWGKRWS